MTGDSSCVSIRARVRKSKRAIDPEFDSCVETLVSFTDGPSLLLTPEPTIVRSISRGGSMAPARRRQGSFGQGGGAGAEQHYYSRKQSIGSLSSSNGERSSPGDNDNGMVDVSLEDEIETPLNTSIASQASSATNGNGNGLSQSNHCGLPKHPSNKRYSSPFAVHRVSSNASNNGSAVSVSQSDVLGASVRSGRSHARSRSTSRSRSRRRTGGGGGGGSHMRMRSLGAANAFATAGGPEEEGEAAERQPPMRIPLKDILSVDEEVPSRHGSNAGGGSDFFSSAASDAGAAKEGGGDGRRISESGSAVMSPPPSASNGKTPYRIFLHTLSHGYVEFSLDRNANSHDIFMAYLKAHLPPDRIPDRDKGRGKEPMSGGMLRTLVLTPTKEVPSNLSGSERTLDAKPDNGGANPVNKYGHSSSAPTRTTTSLSRPPLVTRSKSEMSVNNIDKLHSKAIRQRLQDESTPMQRMKERMATFLSNAMDCACCQDTTVAPLDVSSGTYTGGEGIKHSLNECKKRPVGIEKEARKPPHGRSPNSEKLRNKGIGGLSFEELSYGGTPKLSFERSVGGESAGRKRL